MVSKKMLMNWLNIYHPALKCCIRFYQMAYTSLITNQFFTVTSLLNNLETIESIKQNPQIKRSV